MLYIEPSEMDKTIGWLVERCLLQVVYTYLPMKSRDTSLNSWGKLVSDKDTTGSSTGNH